MSRRFLPIFAVLFAFVAFAAPAVHAGEAGDPGEKSPELINLHPGAEQFTTAITTLIIFIVLLAVLGKFAWGPIVKGLQAREDKIRKDLADAEQARVKAEAALREYNQKIADTSTQVQQIITTARTDAEKLATNLRMQAQQETEEIKERATKEIDQARDAAIREVYEQAATLATTVAEKILRRNLNADDQRDLVQQSIEQVGAVSKN